MQQNLAGPLVFVHIPKAGGTSLSRALSEQFDPTKVLVSNTNPKNVGSFRTQDLGGMEFISGHFAFGDLYSLVGKNALYITMLRHPVERFISEFYYLKTLPKPTGVAFHKYRKFEAELKPYVNLSLDEHVTNLVLQNRSYECNQQTKSLVDIAFISLEDSEAIFREINKSLSKFSFVGVIERYEDSMNLLAFRLGWYPFRKQKVLNRTIHPDRHKDLLSSTVENIERLNVYDVQTYNHSLQLFEESYQLMVRELLDEYGNTKERCSNVKPSLETVYRLLTERYMHQQLLNSNALDIICDVIRNRYGWYKVECDEKFDKFRWTGPTKKSIVNYPYSEFGELNIVIVLLGGVTDEVLNSFSLLVDGEVVSLEKSLTDEGAFQFFGKFTRRCGDYKYYIPLQFSTANVASKTVDSRLLGVACRSIEITKHQVKTNEINGNFSTSVAGR